jgi:hypothetical protein
MKRVLVFIGLKIAECSAVVLGVLGLHELGAWYDQTYWPTIAYRATWYERVGNGFVVLLMGWLLVLGGALLLLGLVCLIRVNWRWAKKLTSTKERT